MISFSRPLAGGLGHSRVLPFQGTFAMSHPLKLCSVKQLKSDFGIPYSRQHLWRLQSSGEFPRAVKLGPCRVAFRICDIEEWIQARLERPNQHRRDNLSEQGGPSPSTAGGLHAAQR